MSPVVLSPVEVEEAADPEEPEALLPQQAGEATSSRSGARVIGAGLVAAFLATLALVPALGAAPLAPARSEVVDAGISAAASCGEPQEGVNNGGANLRDTAEETSSAEECCNKCADTSACRGYTWVKGNGQCWLKSSLGENEEDWHVISGEVDRQEPASSSSSTTPRHHGHGGGGSAVSDAGLHSAHKQHKSQKHRNHTVMRQPLAPLAAPDSKQDAGWGEATNCQGHASIGGEKSAKLLGKTLRMKVDVSQIGCGCVTGVYLVEWGDGGDCDASGSFGGRCGEIDIMEANKFAWHTTLHNPQDHPGLAGGFGGVQQFDMMYGKGPRDMAGDQYGPDGSVIDTNQAFHVAVSFPQRPDGSLADMVVMMHQEGKEHAIEFRVNRPRADPARSPPMTCEDAGCENCYSKPGCVYKEDDLAAFGSWLGNGMTPLATYWGGPGNTWIDGSMDDEAGGCRLGAHGTPGTEDYGDYQGGGGCGDAWFSVGEFTLEDVQDPGMEWDEFFRLMDRQPLVRQA